MKGMEKSMACSLSAVMVKSVTAKSARCRKPILIFNMSALYKIHNITYSHHYFSQHARGFVGGLVEGSIIITAIYKGKVKAQLIGQFLDEIHAVSLVLVVALQLLVAFHQLGIWFVLELDRVSYNMRDNLVRDCQPTGTDSKTMKVLLASELSRPSNWEVVGASRWGR